MKLLMPPIPPPKACKENKRVYFQYYQAFCFMLKCLHHISTLKRKLNLVFVKSVHVSYLGPYCAMHVLVGRPEGKNTWKT